MIAKLIWIQMYIAGCLVTTDELDYPYLTSCLCSALFWLNIAC